MPRTSSRVPGQQVEPLRGWNRFRSRRRRRTAQFEAEFLDSLVNAELEFMNRLPVGMRDRPADALAVLVMLAQDYRHYAQGWTNRHELKHRAEGALTELDVLRQVPMVEPLPANRID
ncbi:MAG: hypothetical protein ACRDS1_02380 [Pseudonocardiaceae bacterium]